MGILKNNYLTIIVVLSVLTVSSSEHLEKFHKKRGIYGLGHGLNHLPILAHPKWSSHGYTFGHYPPQLKPVFAGPSVLTHGGASVSSFSATYPTYVFHQKPAIQVLAPQKPALPAVSPVVSYPPSYVYQPVPVIVSTGINPLYLQSHPGVLPGNLNLIPAHTGPVVFPAPPHIPVKIPINYPSYAVNPVVSNHHPIYVNIPTKVPVRPIVVPAAPIRPVISGDSHIIPYPSGTGSSNHPANIPVSPGVSPHIPINHPIYSFIPSTGGGQNVIGNHVPSTSGHHNVPINYPSSSSQPNYSTPSQNPSNSGTHNVYPSFSTSGTDDYEIPSGQLPLSYNNPSKNLPSDSGSDITRINLIPISTKPSNSLEYIPVPASSFQGHNQHESWRPMAPSYSNSATNIESSRPSISLLPPYDRNEYAQSQQHSGYD